MIGWPEKMSPPQAQEEALPTFTREEVAQHNKYSDCWVVLHGRVYDVTKWLPKHPGGARILMHYAGEDATVSSMYTQLVHRSIRGYDGDNGRVGLDYGCWRILCELSYPCS